MNNRFQVTSGAVRVTDPCYTNDTWCAGKIDNVMNGTWCGGVQVTNMGSWGSRVGRVYAMHDSAGSFDSSDDWVETEITVGVDSGQAGIFDDGKYPGQSSETIGEYGDESTFYGKVCALTLADESWGVVDFGVVSSSGLGDGSYAAYTLTKDGQVVGVYIDFGLDQEDEGQDYDDDDNGEDDDD